MMVNGLKYTHEHTDLCAVIAGWFTPSNIESEKDGYKCGQFVITDRQQATGGIESLKQNQ